LGAHAGRYNQGSYATALGQAAGLQSQGTGAVAIGQAGYESQGQYAVAIGSGAGDTNQGNNAIAIGYQAGTNNQTANSIILNASGSALDSSGVAGLFINPVRNNLASNANVVFFNTSTKELTYANTISLAGNITGGNIRTAGVVSATGNITGGNITIAGISNLSSNANVKITGGTTGQALTTDGAGNLSWTTLSSGNTVPTYGQFWSNLTQNVVAANTQYQFLFNNTDGHNNIDLGTGTSNSRIIFNKTGLYDIKFSVQIDRTVGNGSSSTAYIWLKKNGVSIADSAGFFTLDSTIQTVTGWDIVANVANVGDYYEVAYAASTTNFRFPTLLGDPAFGLPSSPSIIVTITPVGA
jgi:hypothetical protein